MPGQSVGIFIAAAQLGRIGIVEVEVADPRPEGFDLLDVRGGDTHAPTGKRAPGACQAMRGVRLVAPTRLVAAQLTTDGAGRTIDHQRDSPDGEAGFVQSVDAVSFMQVQEAMGNSTWRCSRSG